MNLQNKIEIILKKQHVYHTAPYYNTQNAVSPYDATLETICKKADEWIGTECEDLLASIINENVNEKFYEGLTKPLSERKWKIPYDNRGAAPKRDMIYLRGQIGADYYIYVKNCFDGAYGAQFEVAVNGGDNLYLLPTIKQFTDELEVGKCFIVHFEKVVEFGNNRKKYCYVITEISEQEYLDNAIDAQINTFAY